MEKELTIDILSSVQKPARYTGGEFASIIKPADEVEATICLAFPDVYEVGMSYLGFKILYHLLNKEQGVQAERVYAPWIDMEEIMRQRQIPLFSLESFHAIKEFDFLGFSLQYEMIYSNVLNMLDLAGIPIWSRDRGENDPFIVGGGPCVYNTEPIADFFDFFIVGEGEELICETVDVFRSWQEAGKPEGRQGLLKRLAVLDGIYVPSFLSLIHT